MRTVTIGFLRDDGDIQVLATLHNNDELLPEEIFAAVTDGLVRKFSRYITEEISVFEREDAPDYITLEE